MAGCDLFLFDHHDLRCGIQYAGCLQPAVHICSVQLLRCRRDAETHRTDPGDPLRRYRNRRSQETRSCHCRYGSGDGRYLRAGITADHGDQYHKHPAHVCNDFQERIRFPFYFRRIRRFLHYVGYQKRSVLQRGWYGFCSECCRKSRCFSSGKTGAGADAFCIYRYAFDLFSNGIHVPEH